MNKNKGFTLIELLVVIAIIGILSSVVLASLNSARNKGADTATKNNLANMRAQAELFYDTGNTYESLCDQPTIAQMRASANNSSGGTTVCNAAASAWAAQAPIKAGGFWCVDSTGASKAVTTALSTNTVCPAS
ncbi:MAG: type II secretion system protein [Sphingobacteriia bacterium]|nr:type II secretion system protein [Sphingobacteriia bacterium]